MGRKVENANKKRIKIKKRFYGHNIFILVVLGLSLMVYGCDKEIKGSTALKNKNVSASKSKMHSPSPEKIIDFKILNQEKPSDSGISYELLVPSGATRKEISKLIDHMKNKYLKGKTELIVILVYDSEKAYKNAFYRVQAVFNTYTGYENISWVR